ncbi:MAG: DNA glycosylase, partial [Limisphaerales bacterium]
MSRLRSSLNSVSLTDVPNSTASRCDPWCSTKLPAPSLIKLHSHRLVSTTFPAENYALAETLTSGQAFRWRNVDDGWESVVNGRWVRLVQKDRGIHASVYSADENVSWDWLRDYLQVDVNISQITATFPPDEHLRAAVEQ